MKEEEKGLFLVLEGVDGCGKSTQAALLAERLRGLGRKVRALREPGSTPPGEKVRELLLDPATGSLDPATEALLFMACRRELVSREILPALEGGEDVVLERFHPSTICYQGAGLGLGTERVEELARWTTPGLEPDLVLLLDLPAAEALARLDRGRDRLEGRGGEYLEKVRRAFLDWARSRPGTVVVDASLSTEEVARALWEEVKRVLPAE